MRSVVDCAGFSIAKDRPGGGNEDCLDYLPKVGAPCSDWTDSAAIVVDGVGSSAAPRDAAVAAAKTWMTFARAKFVENGRECAGFDERHFNEITSHAFSQAHESVLAESKGSACAAAVCLQGSRLLVGNVGDCRVYKISGPRIEQLSKDQVDSVGDPTDVLGGKRAPEAITSSSTRVRAGDVVVLCTDGVWKLISVAEIQQSARGNAQEIVAKLQSLINARRGPGSDDATAIVVVINQVGRPFWDTESRDDDMRDDLVESKVNEVLAELLNRLRAPLDKQNAKAEQAINQLTATVDDLRGELEALKSDGPRARSARRSSPNSVFTSVALGILLFASGVFFGMGLRDRAHGKTLAITPQLPAKAQITSQHYANDRLLINFTDADNKPKLAIFRLEDGGTPYAIIDAPIEKKSDVPVP